MGGGQANKGQATASFGAAQDAAAKSAAIGSGYAADSNKIRDMFFGANGTPGTLTNFLDPNSINVSEPSGIFKQNYEHAVNLGAQNQQQGTANIIRNAASRGLGLDNAAIAEGSRHNMLDAARMKGDAFASAVGQQHDEALQNFWGATNVAQGVRAGDQTAAVGATGNAAQTNANLYGTSGAYHQGPAAGIIGSALGAAGTVGAAAMTGGTSTAATAGTAAACPTGKAKIEMASVQLAADEVVSGLIVEQRSGYGRVEKTPEPVIVPCVRVVADGMATEVADLHCFELATGGYVYAKDAINKYVSTRNGVAFIREVIAIGEQAVYPLIVGGDHTYLCDGFWSLE